MRSWSWNKKCINPNFQTFLDVLVEPSEPAIDIVAVHGLNPINKDSHAENTWKQGGKLWLRDFLPHQVPEARILLFGYNSNIAFGTATSGVREQAENLLNLLAYKRMKDPNRPLIFICHSLGGLVVKRAIVHANSDKTYKDIFSSTFGVAFLGTPHRGGNHANFGSIVATITRSVAGNPGNTFMESLKPGSITSNNMADDFRQFLENLSIISFYETRPLGQSGIIVDKESATLGLPGTREKQIPLDADHRNICKFESEDNPIYKQVADNVSELAEMAIRKWRERPSQTNSQEGGDKLPTTRTEGNECRIHGDSNEMRQAGWSNWSCITGNTNETAQFGDRNWSDTDGSGNVTTQVSSIGIDLTKMAEAFLWKGRD